MACTCAACKRQKRVNESLGIMTPEQNRIVEKKPTELLPPDRYELGEEIGEVEALRLLTGGEVVGQKTPYEFIVATDGAEWLFADPTNKTWGSAKLSTIVDHNDSWHRTRIKPAPRRQCTVQEALRVIADGKWVYSDGGLRIGLVVRGTGVWSVTNVATGAFCLPEKLYLDPKETP